MSDDEVQIEETPAEETTFSVSVGNDDDNDDGDDDRRYIEEWTHGGPEPTVKSTDMKAEMVRFSLVSAAKALKEAEALAEKRGDVAGVNIFSDMAEVIKKDMDARYHPQWHCIVGRSFGSWVVHEVKTFCFFFLGTTAVLLFKAGGHGRNAALPKIY